MADRAASFGTILAFGIEGTGSYGATLASFLRRTGHRVVEAGRPDRLLRRMNGKSDTLDAENAARAVLAGIAPVPTGSGMTSGRHRINHGGHRQLNAAIYRTVIVRMRFHQPTIDYVAGPARSPPPAALRPQPSARCAGACGRRAGTRTCPCGTPLVEPAERPPPGRGTAPPARLTIR